MYYKNMEAHGAYPGLPTVEAAIIKSVAEDSSERTPRSEMTEQLENMRAVDSTLKTESNSEAPSVEVGDKSVEDLLSSMSPEARENAESIFSELGAPIVASEVVVVTPEDVTEMTHDTEAYANDPVNHVATETNSRKLSVDEVSAVNENLNNYSTNSESSVTVTSNMEGRPSTPGSNVSPELSGRLDSATKKFTEKKSHQARELRDARKDEREKVRAEAENAITSAQQKLFNAKDERVNTVMRHNRLTQSLRSAELKGQYRRVVQERIDKGDLAEKSRRTQRAYMKGAKALAKTDARKERVDARSNAAKNIVNARVELARNKAIRRDTSRWNRKGGRNTHFENKRIISSAGFSMGEISGAGLTDEQKKKLEERRRNVYAGARGTSHAVRGRKSTRSAAKSSR